MHEKMQSGIFRYCHNLGRRRAVFGQSKSKSRLRMKEFLLSDERQGGNMDLKEYALEERSFTACQAESNPMKA